MALYAKVHRMHLRDGLSITEIARRTSLSRNTIKAWLRGPVRSGMKPVARRAAEGSQDDHRAARSPGVSLPHRRDGQRVLSLPSQELHGQDPHQDTRPGPAQIAAGGHRPEPTGIESSPAGQPAGFLPWSTVAEHRWSVFGKRQQLDEIARFFDQSNTR